MKTVISPVGKAIKTTKSQSGYSYVVLLVSLIIIGIGAQTTHLLLSRLSLAEQEKELLFRGLAYRQAIGAYYKDVGHYPKQIDDLYRDSSSIKGKHYIRALYPEPISGEWHLIRNGAHEIVGVASSSEKSPRKKANFPQDLESFNDAESYRDWQFVFHPPQQIPSPN